AILSVHSITAFPLRVAPEARIVIGDVTTSARLEPISGASMRDGCFSLEGPGNTHALRIVGAPTALPRGRGEILLWTCEPRIERTPDELTSNLIEIRGR